MKWNVKYFACEATGCFLNAYGFCKNPMVFTVLFKNPRICVGYLANPRFCRTFAKPLSLL